jgi:ectoine hydroxylase-related dioxygenase (phytanoyl-CoA dioxygenase family)
MPINGLFFKMTIYQDWPERKAMCSTDPIATQIQISFVMRSRQAQLARAKYTMFSAEVGMLSAEQVESLREHGACLLPRFLNADEITAIRDGITVDLTKTSPFKTEIEGKDGAPMSTNIWRSQDVEEFRSFCRSDKLVGLARTIFNGQAFRFLQDTWFYRPPTCSVGIPWHHDNIVEGHHYSVWVSLTEHQQGDSLKFVSGSHRRGLEYMPKSYFGLEGAESSVEQYYLRYNKVSNGNLGTRFVPVPSESEIKKHESVVSWPSLAGDCIVFNSRVLHSLGCQDIAHERTGFVTRWIEEGSRVADHAGQTIQTIVDAGLDVELVPGGKIKGSVFTLYS